MTTTMEIDQPVEVVFERWTRFEEFPTFMDDVDAVTELDEGHYRWTVRVGGLRTEWEAEIVDLVPLRHISWRATDGTHNSGEVSFRRLPSNCTLVALDIDVDPGEVAPQAEWIDVSSGQAREDLRSFKERVEHPRLGRRPQRTPSWIPPQFTPAAAEARSTTELDPQAIDLIRVWLRAIEVVCDACLFVTQLAVSALSAAVPRRPARSARRW
jgi:uncharacterized protein YndB with AHSA1/START domain